MALYIYTHKLNKVQKWWEKKECLTCIDMVILSKFIMDLHWHDENP